MFGPACALAGAKRIRAVTLSSSGPECRSSELLAHIAVPNPEAPMTDRVLVQSNPDEVEQVIAPTAIERALAVYQQLNEHDQSVVLQARKILTQHIYGMVDQGERDLERLVVGGLARLKAVERDHEIKSAQS